MPDQETVGGGVYQSDTGNVNSSFFKSSGTTQAFEINTPICVNFRFNLKFTLKNESDNDIFFNRHEQLTILVHAELMIVIIGHDGAV